MGEKLGESPDCGTSVGSVGYGSAHDHVRTTALDMAIRASGVGAPVQRITQAADAFYQFLTTKS